MSNKTATLCLADVASLSFSGLRGHNMRILVTSLLLWPFILCAGEVVENGGELAKVAKEQLLKADTELANTRGTEKRFVALGYAAFWNGAVGDQDKARAYADELLALAAKRKKNWNYGNAVHKAHLAYGLIAFRKDDLVTASTELLVAGNTPGSPQLNSFGPNMLLARALLKTNERGTVLKYLDLCAVFWKDGQLPREELAAWKKQINDGAKLKFGANLLY